MSEAGPVAPVRSFGQPLYPVAGEVCPVCREPIDRAEVIVYERARFVPARWWWRAVARLLRRAERERMGLVWEEASRAVAFGPCACLWRSEEQPMTVMVVRLRPEGAWFSVEARRWRSAPQVEIR